MPEPVYRTEAPSGDRESATLVITCSSNTFAPGVREFLDRHLGLPEGAYDQLSVPGGPQFLLLTEYLPKFAWAGQRWVKFLIEKHRLTRVVLISHEACAWQTDARMIPALLRRVGVGLPSAAATIEPEVDKLSIMVQAIHDLSLPVTVEAYVARRESDGRVGFVRAG